MLKEKIQAILDSGVLLNRIQHFFRKPENKHLLSLIHEQTNFLHGKVVLGERIYCILNDIHNNIKCSKQGCSNNVPFLWVDVGYGKYCSRKCTGGDKIRLEKVKQTNLKNYGVEYPSQSNVIKEKIRNNNLIKYGVENIFQSEIFKERIKKTNLEKYGVEYSGKSEIIRSKIKKTNFRKYGFEIASKSKIVKDKIKKTNFKKYGSNCPLGNDNIQAKSKNTVFNNYGVINVSQSDFIKNKKAEKSIEKYGVTNPLKNTDILSKLKQTNLKRYGVEYSLQNKDVRDKMKATANKNILNGIYDTMIRSLNRMNEDAKKYNANILFKDGNYNIHCNECNNISVENRNFISSRLFYNKITPCPICRNRYSSSPSGIENTFHNFIKDIYDSIIEQSNRKLLQGKEIDIYLEELNIGIEINGLYWHSDEYKDKNAHYDKLKLCREKGIQLYQFFEDELPQAMMLIYSIIANKGALKPDIDINELNEKYGLSIKSFEKSKFYARECNIVKIIDKDKAKEMLELYHIQGSDKAKYYYGLIDKDGSLLSVMTFKKMSVDKNQKKSNNEDTYELSRYVTLPGIQIIGGFQKLLKSFIKDIPNAKILTYSNLRYSNEDDNVYMRNGFINNGFTGVNYYYYFKGRRFHRFNFRKDNLYNNILPKYGVDVSEDYKSESESGMVQKLIDNGHDVHKVYDCGNIKWIYNS